MLIDGTAAAALLRAGEVVALPTDTVYGVCAALDVEGATARLFEVKGRPATVPLPVFVPDPTDAFDYGDFDGRARELAAAHWPGPLTIVVARTAASSTWDLGGDGATVGLRCPNDDVVRAIVRATGPLAVTSANRHGEPPCMWAAEVEAALGEEFPVLDGGRRAAIPSTVVDCTTEPPTVLRRGVVTVNA